MIAGLIIGFFIVILLSLWFIFSPYRLSKIWRYFLGNLEMSAGLDVVLTKNEAVIDIDYILKRFGERHPAAIKGIPQTMIKQAQIEKNNLPEQITVLQLWQATARILAVLRDGHTRMEYLTKNILCLPFTFQYSNNKLISVEGDFIGCEVLSIGGISINDLYNTKKSQFSYELDGYLNFDFARNCRSKHFLAFLNVDVSEPISLVFDTPEGEVSQKYEFAKPKETQNEQSNKYVWYSIDKENNLGIFTLTKCKIDKVYHENLNNFFDEVKNAEITNIVVDLRENSGGISKVVDMFLKYLDVDCYRVYGDTDIRLGFILWKSKSKMKSNPKKHNLLYQGAVFVLTSSYTFSSATAFAQTISDNKIGKIVGEISGGMPSCYGDIVPFQTPSAKLGFTISYKYFRRPDENKDELPLIPDYPCTAKDALDNLYTILQK